MAMAVTPVDPRPQAAEMLGMEASELGAALRRRKVRVTQAGRESVHEARPHRWGTATRGAAGWGWALYKRLFERLVQRINSSSACEEDEQYHEIGILDIYGFERLQRSLASDADAVAGQ
eukprot:Skav232403  [mRNA]  locus=scaffold1077:731752:733242:- [translate_table: standard]